MGRERVLLVNPPVYDTKLHWPRWYEPQLLYRASSFFRERGADVRYLDALADRPHKQLPRLLAGRFVMDGMPVQLWRYGLRPAVITRALRSLRASQWSPNKVVIEGAAAWSWQAVREVSRMVQHIFPETRVRIIGEMVDSAAWIPGCIDERGNTEAEERAVLTRHPSALDACEADWSLWRDDVSYLGDSEVKAEAPAIAYLAGTADQDVIRLESELARAIRAGIRVFSLGDRESLAHRPDSVRQHLETVLRLNRKVSLVSIGTMEPRIILRTINEDRELPSLMRRAGLKQIFFADDRNSPTSGREGVSADEDLVAAYQEIIPELKKAGYLIRSDAINAGMSLGRPYEDLSARATLATRLSAAVGAMVVWPYQPTPDQCLQHGGPSRLELQNGKVYPLRHTSGANYRDVLNVLGLTVVLNSKYREFTFDFAGDTFVAQLFRDSIARRAWEAPDAVKGTLRLPALPPRPERAA